MSIAPANLIALSGAVITCPQCDSRIGVLRLPLYQGTDCTCTPTTCTCAVETYERCETAPAP